MFYLIIYKFMLASILHKGLWHTVGHLVHTNATWGGGGGGGGGECDGIF